MVIDIRKAYRFKLKPTPQQKQALAQAAGCCRWIYNWGLRQRKEVYTAVKDHRPEERKEALKIISYPSQASQIKFLREQFPFLAEVPFHALQAALENLDEAYQNFFHGAGFPRFKSKKEGDSFTEKDKKEFDYNGQAVRLPKIGWVRYFNSRRIIGQKLLLTVKREGNDWFAIIATRLEINVEPKKLLEHPPVGMDVGVAKSLAFSDHTENQLPVMDSTEEKKMARLQRVVSRRQKGSHHWWQAIGRVGKFRRHIAHRVQDARHKCTTHRAKNHSFVFGENLAVRNMMRSACGTVEEPGVNVAQKQGLNRVMGYEGFGETFRQLDYKCLWNGGYFIQVPAAGTSQRCRKCHHEAPENRPSQAVFRCLKCGHQDNADFNSAENILDAGMELARKKNLLTADGLAVAARGGSEGNRGPIEARTRRAKGWRRKRPPPSPVCEKQPGDVV
jgi:putative transposase